MTANPAAGPLTPNGDLLTDVTTVPPIIPAIIPEKSGAPDASAIPRHKGTATRKTTILAGISYFKLFINEFVSFFVILY